MGSFKKLSGVGILLTFIGLATSSCTSRPGKEPQPAREAVSKQAPNGTGKSKPVDSAGTKNGAGVLNAAQTRREGGAASDIVLSFTGDCVFGAVNGDSSNIRFPSIYRMSGRPDYPFAKVKRWFENDDLTVVNYEGTLTEAVPTANKQWKFKGPASYAAILPAASVEVAGLSNNHSHDYLEKGLEDTIRAFQAKGVGVFYQNTPYITTLKGIPIVLIGDCTVIGENTTLKDGVEERVLQQIKRSKRPDNIVVVVMHWGSELATTPFPWQQDYGRRFVDAGADAVVGAHPHVLQGIERYKGRYIAYSLGNFAFGGNSLAHFPETFIFRLRFPIQGNKIGLPDAEIIPCYVSSSKTRNEAGILRNNYQPKPLMGKEASQVAALTLQRSALLDGGIKNINYNRLW